MESEYLLFGTTSQGPPEELLNWTVGVSKWWLKAFTVETGRNFLTAILTEDRSKSQKGYNTKAEAKRKPATMLPLRTHSLGLFRVRMTIKVYTPSAIQGMTGVIPEPGKSSLIALPPSIAAKSLPIIMIANPRSICIKIVIF
jgi:hypothetical protein